MTNEKILKRHYQVVLPIGQGAFGCVRLGYHRLTGTLVAIKTVEKTKKNLRWIFTEKVILEMLEHPYIIRLYQVIISEREVHYVTEFAPGGNLFRIVKDNGRMQEGEAKKVFGQILAAIKYCHNLDIVHRDLKPQNILLDGEGNVKVIDFGLSTKTRSGTKLTRCCGTKAFSAPELVQGQPYDGKKADVWSLGVLLYYITTGNLPFKEQTIKETEAKIITGLYNIPDHFSSSLENLIFQMLNVMPERRPSVEDLEKHPWVKKYEINVPKEMYPDPKIVDMLCEFGFNRNSIFESLGKNKYDEIMALYLILKEKERKGLELGSTTEANPVDPGPTPPSTPAYASVSSLPLKRITSAPTFGLLHAKPSAQHQPVARTLLGKKLVRSASLPAVNLCFSRNNSPAYRACSCALHSQEVWRKCQMTDIQALGSIRRPELALLLPMLADEHVQQE
ncbi:putative sperm motility kinase W, partial [Psammomys obesus]|uniref:putative sperm motility kinase W n=1 Tax=Psammomys obesus TaxID=48139 RepID=UPI002452A023